MSLFYGYKQKQEEDIAPLMTYYADNHLIESTFWQYYFENSTCTYIYSMKKTLILTQLPGKYQKCTIKPWW
jgi:hypothetical protein